MQKLEFTIKPKDNAPKHARADVITQLCVAFYEDKTQFGKWLGQTKHLSVARIWEMLTTCKREGTPPKRLFLYLLKESKK